MKTNHTPGPWLIAGTTIYALTQYTGNSDTMRTHLADGINRFSARVSSDNPERDGGAPPEEIQANARLIAAAPELLEALRLAEDLLSSYLPSHKPASLLNLNVIRAAIAKATQE